MPNSKAESMKLKTFFLPAAIVLVLLGTSPAVQAQTGGAINACYNTTNGQLRRVNSSAEFKNNETPLAWNVDGAKGDKGDTGAQGMQGEKGEKGDTGAHGLAINPAGTRVYGTEGSGTVSVIVTITNTIIGTILIANGALGIAFR